MSDEQEVRDEEEPEEDDAERSARLQREAEEKGEQPDPSKTGWDSAAQKPVSPSANPDNYLKPVE